MLSSCVTSSSVIAHGNPKRFIIRFQRVQHTITRKKFPILGQILDHLNTIPVVLRVVGPLLFVIWKFYIMYLLIRFLLVHDVSISSSAHLNLIKENGAVAGGFMNHTAGHMSTLLGKSDGSHHLANEIPVEVDENG